MEQINKEKLPGKPEGMGDSGRESASDGDDSDGDWSLDEEELSVGRERGSIKAGRDSEEERDFHLGSE